MPHALAKLIRDRRQDLGLTQEELAERIGDGTRQAEVSKLEGGHVKLPRRPRMERLARALELPIGELLLQSGWAGADALDNEPGATRERRPYAGRADPPSESQQNLAEMKDLTDELRANADRLQRANDLLRERALDRAVELRALEVSVHQLTAVLNALSDPVVVVDRTGVIVAENTAYAVFSAKHTDSPKMLDLDGKIIAEDDLPLELASRGEQFEMAFIIDDANGRLGYRAEGQPASAIHGGLLGVATFRELGPSS